MTNLEDFEKVSPRVVGEWDREKKSLAVVASNGSHGAVIWYVGFSISMEVEEAGLDTLCDLGLDDAPVGISIWEGTYVWSPGPFEHPNDGDMWPSGSFRDPTDDEWQAIRKGECPWNPDDWRVK